jgi:hypothetical protein
MKWRKKAAKKGVFAHLLRDVVCAELVVDTDASRVKFVVTFGVGQRSINSLIGLRKPLLRKTPPFLSAFPMFVPSLSW